MSELPAHLQHFSEYPAEALQAYGKVQNLENEFEVDYSPWTLTKQLQETVLAYITNPPMDEDGYNQWLVVLKGRQLGISTCVASGYYVKAQYTAGWTHVTSADKQGRADTLFERVQYLNSRWPDELKIPTLSSNQVRSYHWNHNGKMVVMSGAAKGMAIGSAASSWHWSEIPLWRNAAKQWSEALPAIINRKNAQMVWESTPFPLSEPSAPFFRKLCQRAADGTGRFIFAFEPFWDGKLNARTWRRGDKLTIEEQRLLDRYHPLGLRKRHLAFRRDIMASDEKIASNPELFRVFYPFDDLTCWMAAGAGVIKSRHIDRHLDGLQPFNWTQGWMQYAEPRDDAIYVIGVDPSGYGARDHCAFQVLEVWAGSWRQVYTYASQADPPEFARKLNAVGRMFNDAQVLVERNGVGIGVIALLEEMRYPNLYWDSNDKPGMHKSSGSEGWMLSYLVDALDETLVLNDRLTVEQLQDYRSDRAIERTYESELIRGDNPDKRRDRDHWDSVSALMYAIIAARNQPQRRAPFEMRVWSHDDGVMTANDMTRYARLQKQFQNRHDMPAQNQRRNYNRRRR